MITIKTSNADLTSPGQKLIALGMIGVVLTILWFLLPPIITILTNIWWTIGLGVPLLFLAWNYEAVWSMFKRLSWNMTKKIISSDKLWYLWQGYNYLLKENDAMQQDINNVVASRLKSQKMLEGIVKDSNRAMQEHEQENEPNKKRVLEVKVTMLDEQFKNIEPKVKMAQQQENDLKDYYDTRVADTEILKIKLDAKAQEYELYKQMSEASDNASRWMKESNQMKMFNESLRQIDQSLDTYTANIENFRRNILPKMSSDSASKRVDADNGVKLIEEWKKKRLELKEAA